MKTIELIKKTALIFICFMLVCCKPESKPGSIYGTVTDKSSGDCVAYAGVELLPNGLRTVTGMDGTFEFTLLEPGDYNLYVTKTGYRDSKSNTIAVSSGKQVKGDVQIEKLPASLQILDNDGNVITELNFGGDEGVVSKTFKLYNIGDAPFSVNIYKDVDWIENISPDSGTVPVNGNFPVIVKINRGKLANGINTTSIIISSETVGGVELTVKAIKGGVPSVYTNESPTNITSNSATCGGNVTSDGNSSVDQRGIYYSTSQNPATTGQKVPCSTSGTGDFSCLLTGLSANTKYYYCAYAINSEGPAYGDTKEFTTLALLPTFQYSGTTYYVHPDAGKMTWESAKSYCNNLTFGGYSDWFLPDKDELNTMYVNRESIGGFTTTYDPNHTHDCRYWSSTKDYNPWYQDFYNGHQDDAYESYYYRVRPVRKDGGGGGTTPNKPTVITNEPSTVTYNSATCGGNVTSDGGADIIERGIRYSTSQNLETTGVKLPFNTNGTGVFTCSITGLSASTKYYYWAYAINSEGESHGERKEFTTLSGGGGGGTAPSAPTDVSAEVSGSRIKVSWNSVSNANEYLVYWSNNDNNYTIVGTTTSLFYYDDAPTEYNYYKVKAKNSYGESPFSQYAYCHYSSGGGGSAPSAPTGISALVSGSQIIVSWNSVSNADEYTVYWSNDGNTYGDIGTTSNLYFYDDVPYEENYYKVKAKNSYGESPFSSYVYCHYSSGGHVEGWLQYDDGNEIGAAGFTDGGTFYWADMFPASMLSQYVGTSITKVEANFNRAGVYTLQIYSGGTTSPETLIFERSYTHNYSTTVWATMTLPNPVSLNTSKNLWIVISTTHLANEYPAGFCQNSGEPNGRWYSDGIDWEEHEEYTWGIHTFVSNGVKGEVQIGNKQQSKSETDWKKRKESNVSKHGINRR